MLSFKDYQLKDLILKNKIVMPPMCTYMSNETGEINQFHLTHYEARAIGQVGLIIVEATAVEKDGRISPNDLGIWSNDQIPGLKLLNERLHLHGSKTALQLGHAGRKAILDDGEILAPSALAYDENHKIPKEISKEEITRLIDSYQKAAIRADKANFDIIEVHAAHGYLIHQFLSPLSNKRRDAYGGSLENRTRFLREILAAIKKVWDKPILLRVSADDYLDGGIDINEMIRIINNVKIFIDLVHVSSGGLAPAEIGLFPGYQVSYADKIKKECEIGTIAVGLINDLDLVEEILVKNQADLVALGRKLLREPNFVMNELYKNHYDYPFPKVYERAYRYSRKLPLKEI